MRPGGRSPHAPRDRRATPPEWRPAAGGGPRRRAPRRESRRGRRVPSDRRVPCLRVRRPPEWRRPRASPRRRRAGASLVGSLAAAAQARHTGCRRPAEHRTIRPSPTRSISTWSGASSQTTVQSSVRSRRADGWAIRPPPQAISQRTGRRSASSASGSSSKPRSRRTPATSATSISGKTIDPLLSFGGADKQYIGTGPNVLGWGLAAAFGAKLARPDLPVVSVVGDGSFCFCRPAAAVDDRPATRPRS